MSVMTKQQVSGPSEWLDAQAVIDMMDSANLMLWTCVKLSTGKQRRELLPLLLPLSLTLFAPPSFALALASPKSTQRKRVMTLEILRSLLATGDLGSGVCSRWAHG